MRLEDQSRWEESPASKRVGCPERGGADQLVRLRTSGAERFIVYVITEGVTHRE